MSNQSLEPQNNKEEKHEVITPEFILIDERDGKGQYTHFDSEANKKPYEPSQQESKKSQGVFLLRILCLVGVIFCLFLGLGVLIRALGLTFFSVTSLFRNKILNQEAVNYWKIFISTIISSICLALGFIIPTLGFFLLGLYFSFASKDNFLGEFLNKTFTNNQI